MNDATSDSGRNRLGQLAPALAAAPRTDAMGAAALVVATVLRVPEAVGRSPRLDRVLCRARRRLQRTSVRTQAGPWARFQDLAHRRGAARHHLTAAVDATAVLPQRQRDAVLHDALACALGHHRPPARPCSPGICELSHVPSVSARRTFTVRSPSDPFAAIQAP